MGILGIQHINTDAQPEWEKTGNEPRRPHLQKKHAHACSFSPQVSAGNRAAWRKEKQWDFPVMAKAWGLGPVETSHHINTFSSCSSNQVRKQAAAAVFISSKWIWQWMPGLTKQAPSLSCTPGGPATGLMKSLLLPSKKVQGLQVCSLGQVSGVYILALWISKLSDLGQFHLFLQALVASSVKWVAASQGYWEE